MNNNPNIIFNYDDIDTTLFDEAAAYNRQVLRNSEQQKQREDVINEKVSSDESSDETHKSHEGYKSDDLESHVIVNNIKKKPIFKRSSSSTSKISPTNRRTIQEPKGNSPHKKELVEILRSNVGSKVGGRKSKKSAKRKTRKGKGKKTSKRNSKKGKGKKSAKRKT